MTDAPSITAEPVEYALPAQTLKPGKCGLFLWTRDEPRHFVLFFTAGEATAEAILDGRRQALTIDSQEGDVFGQFLTRMAFRKPDGNPVSLTLSPGEEIEGGRRVPLARLIYNNAEGWEIITPLTGLTACQPE
ncbi:hypothetical protein [Hyphomonas sp.]|uniref:hypothetical protein n=1 Tax=Hyphomonas sp. TaxID=87 RepID=UPI0035277EAA